jgi:hypothetical protein
VEFNSYELRETARSLESPGLPGPGVSSNSEGKSVAGHNTPSLSRVLWLLAIVVETIQVGRASTGLRDRTVPRVRTSGGIVIEVPFPMSAPGPKNRKFLTTLRLQFQQ